MTQHEFLERQWQMYEKICKEKGMEAGTKEDFIERQTPLNFTADMLFEIHPKSNVLHVKTPLFKTEENITISRRELRRMLEDAAQRGYELGKEEIA